MKSVLFVLFLALCASVWQVQTGFLVKDEFVLHLAAAGSVSRVDVFTCGWQCPPLLPKERGKISLLTTE